ncbi:putative glutaredoxin-like, plant II, Thioredoxin-like superfamily [Dioscorea sansibarensis]
MVAVEGEVRWWLRAEEVVVWVTLLKKLLQDLMANPTICEINEGFAEKMTLIDKIAKILSGDDRTLVPSMFPLVFIGGKLVGGLDKLITIHISGKLIPMLKIAGALWL